MGQPFIGEIRMFGGNFAPAGWAFCDGRLIPIADNDALFNLIGTTYGGDGVTTFGLPDLRGRIPLHQGTDPATGTSYTLGQLAGVETVTLTVSQIPLHSHVPLANSSPGNQSNPSNGFWAAAASNLDYATVGGATVTAPMNNSAAGIAGGSQPHDNMMPYLVISFIISLFGIFPSQN